MNQPNIPANEGTKLMDEIPLTLINNLDRKEIEYLWGQGVNCDDWDYMIMCAPENVEEVEAELNQWDRDEGTTCKKVIQCRVNGLSRLLTGCCDNTWYLINFRGKDVAIGVAYHA